MGKPTVKKKKKKKKHSSSKSVDLSFSNSNPNPNPNPNSLEEEEKDASSIFIDVSNDIKNQGNRLFQSRDYKSAILSYEKAIKLLPKSHPNVASIRTNLAACYIQMGPNHYHLALNHCNLALHSSPNHTKALLKRARCYEGLDRLALAQKDIDSVLRLEPNNLSALEISGRIKLAVEAKGLELDDKPMIFTPDVVASKERSRKKKSHHRHNQIHQSKVEEKVVVEVEEEEEAKTRMVKLVFGEDIRCANVDVNCSLSQLREVVKNRFPRLNAVLIKFKDREGDLMTITNLEELRWAEVLGDPQGSIRLYIAEVDAEHEPLFEEGKKGLIVRGPDRNLKSFSDYGSMRSMRYEEDNAPHCIDNWIIEFAWLFRNNVGFDLDEDLGIHELGVKICAEVLEDTVTSDEAQEIFETVEGKFEEMAAVALFSWGNVHMSRAKNKLLALEDSSQKSLLGQFSTYEWVRGQYVLAGNNYEEALKIRPDFFEGLLALGHQQFEQAKLCWYNALRMKVHSENLPSKEVLEGFKNAESNMEKGMRMWEGMEEKRLKKGLSESKGEKSLLENMGLDGLFKEISDEEATEQISNMRSQIYFLWGTMLYEQSGLEFKLGLPMWEESLMASKEKLELAGVSPNDIDVMIKNHTSTQEGLGFEIDEMAQACNGIYDTKRWIRGVPSFRLEPLFRRRVPK